MQDFFISWENTKIYIVVNDKIDNYKNLPKANLYIDNNKMDSEVNYINKYINYTSIDTVSTNSLGNYYVYYKAIFPEYNLTSIIKIEFIVIDNIKPVLNTKELFIKINDKPDVKSLLDYNDNYDNKESIKITFDQESVNYNKIGKYNLRVYLEDLSKNQSYYDIFINVYDNESPIIEIEDDIILNVNSKASDILDYINVKDNDKYSTIKIEYDNITFKEEGKYDVSFKFIDDSNNINDYTFNVIIKDLEAPTILLKSYYIETNKISDELILDNILSITDNYSNYNLTILPYEISAYTNINYQVCDENSNCNNENLIIHLLEYKPYFIYENLILNSYNNINQLYDNINAYDYDGSILTSNINLIYHNVKDNEGKYYAYYKVIGKYDYEILEREIIIKKNISYNNLLIVFIFLILIIVSLGYLIYKYVKKKNINYN